MFISFSRSKMAIALSVVFASLTTGCLDDGLNTTPDSTTSLPTATMRDISVKAQVDSTDAAGSLYTIRQLTTNLLIQGTVADDGSIHETIPAGANLNEPLQISVDMTNDTYKSLTDNVATLEAINTNQTSSQSTRTLTTREDDDTRSTTPPISISLRTTAEFAYADKDQNGLLSDNEIKQKNLDSISADYLEEVQDLMIAADVIQQNPGKLYYKSTYEMMTDFHNDESAKNAFFASNSDSVRDARANLFNEIESTNPEVADFLRLDTNGWPLKHQSRSYEQTPWACADDIRRVSLRNYGTRLWHFDRTKTGNIDNTAVKRLIASANQAQLCKKAGWRLPSVAELTTLLDGGDSKFPNTFPFLSPDSSFWATDDEENTTLVSFSTGSAVLTAPNERSSAVAILHNFEPYDVWFNISPTETPVDLAVLRSQYSQAPENWPQPTVDDGVEWKELGLKPAVPFPSDNPYSKQKVALGKALFFDKRLSKDNTISCASCHDPSKGWADGLRAAVGINGQTGKRNTPTILNTAYYETLFLDGRVSSLEEQSLHPISNPIEMGLPHDEMLNKLDNINEYKPLFTAAFGDNQITLDRIAKSIATFERTIISQKSAFDQFLEGDRTAMTDQQIHGLHLYRTKARCMNCHSGPLMTNNQFENIGLTYYGRSLEDRGRYNVTGNPSDMGKFRVPMLRDIKSTDPVTHLGLFDLSIVTGSGRIFGLLAMYNNGMTRNRSGNFPQYANKYDKKFPEVSPLIERLGMTTEELLALDSFMSAISTQVRDDSASEAELGLTFQ
ncbi:cytochrome c peroxidase [Vibrio sp. Isolate24]|uniref:cytochrome c peroxidase n=1 Tax=Vibrio sp. Isolate24 TaxID=2908534 RepID=UPI001EFE1F6D|nr:cytochrome c peroxidase [Vibrio sp. Isolate24]MCG9677302.1 hypothetical protein [Vibrio sp. Isolate24]